VDSRESIEALKRIEDVLGEMNVSTGAVQARGTIAEVRDLINKAVLEIQVGMVPEMPAGQFKQLRAEAGITQDALAELIGVSVQAVQHWEQGIREIPRYAIRSLLRCHNEYERMKGRIGS